MRFSQVEAATSAQPALFMQNQSLVESLKDELAHHQQDNARLLDEIAHYKNELSCQQKLDGQNNELHFEEELANQSQIQTRLRDEALQYKKDLSCQEELFEERHQEIQTAALLHYAYQREKGIEEIQELNQKMSLYERALNDNVQKQQLMSLQQECKQYATELFFANDATHKAEAQAAAALVDAGLRSEAQEARVQAERHEIGVCAQQLSQNDEVRTRRCTELEELFQTERRDLVFWANNQHEHNLAWQDRLRRTNELRNRRFTELEEHVEAKDARMQVLWQEFNTTELYLKAQEEMNQHMQFVARHELLEFSQRKKELLDELGTSRIQLAAVVQDMEVQTDEMQFRRGYKAPPPTKSPSPSGRWRPTSAAQAHHLSPPQA